MSDHVVLRINGLIVYDSKEPVDPPVEPPVEPPIDPPPAGDGFPPINTGGPTEYLGWGAGHAWMCKNAAQNFTIVPEQVWLDSPSKIISMNTGYSPEAGTTPPWARMSINGTGGWVQYGNYGVIDNQGGTAGFPDITGPFTLTVELFGADKQPVGQPYGVAMVLYHTP